MVANAGPEDGFFFVPQTNEAAADGFCRGDIRCRPMILEGAPKAAEGTSVLVLERLPAATPLDELDDHAGDDPDRSRPAPDPRARR